MTVGVSGAELHEILGHGPAVHHDRAALGGRDLANSATIAGSSFSGLDALVVEEAATGRRVADVKVGSVVARLDAEALRQPPTPGPLLADGACSRGAA